MTSKTTPTPPPAPQALSLLEFCESQRVSRSAAYKEINAGRLRTMKVGARRLVSPQAILDWQKLCEERPHA
jgi:hypothetical protein